MKVAFLVAGVLLLFALLVFCASYIQTRRRDRLRAQWEIASRQLGARFEDDQLRLQGEGTRAHLKFENARAAAPGSGGRDELPRTVLEIRVMSNVDELKLETDQIKASEFAAEINGASRELITGLYVLGLADDLGVEAKGNVVRIDKIGWLDRADDIVEFVSNGQRLAKELSR